MTNKAPVQNINNTFENARDAKADFYVYTKIINKIASAQTKIEAVTIAAEDAYNMAYEVYRDAHKNICNARDACIAAETVSTDSLARAVARFDIARKINDAAVAAVEDAHRATTATKAARAKAFFSYGVEVGLEMIKNKKTSYNNAIVQNIR